MNIKHKICIFGVVPRSLFVLDGGKQTLFSKSYYFVLFSLNEGVTKELRQGLLALRHLRASNKYLVATLSMYLEMSHSMDPK